MKKAAGKLAYRYAKAFYRVLAQSGDGESIGKSQQELAQFAEAWETNAELRAGIINPMFAREERQASLLEIARLAEISELGKKFIQTVFERDRIQWIGQIAEAFSKLADESAGVVKVEVVVPSELDEGEKSQITSRLAELIEGRLEFEWVVDSSLIGGIMVRYQGRVLDGSVNSRLERLERALA